LLNHRTTARKKEKDMKTNHSTIEKKTVRLGRNAVRTSIKAGITTLPPQPIALLK
jgi:hypothetical protein